MSPHATPHMMPAQTSLIKCTPIITRTAAKSTDSAAITTPSAGNGDQSQKVAEIATALNTCLLGNDFPFVSFSMRGLISYNSYGRFRLTKYRNTDSMINPSNGTTIARYKNELFVISK